MPSKEVIKTLEMKCAELESRVNAINADLHKQHSKSFSEQSIERENDDVLQSLLLETRHELKLVNSALQRIASGNYGKCDKCGDEIAVQRLSALPEANTCISCAG